MSSVSTMAEAAERKKNYFLASNAHEFYFSNKHDDEKKRKRHVFMYVLSISLLGLAIYVRFFAKNEENQLYEAEWADSKIKLATAWIDMAKEKVTSISFINAILFGLLMTTFTWMVIFFDSLLPGKYPPSPFSPRKLREQSGHTFHGGYALAVINGIICTLLLCWM